MYYVVMPFCMYITNKIHFLYVTGPDEDIPRKLECMEFVMHAPSDYYKARSTPYPPTNPPETQNSFIWLRLSVKPPKQD